MCIASLRRFCLGAIALHGACLGSSTGIQGAERSFEPFQVTGTVTLEFYGNARRGKANLTSTKASEFAVNVQSDGTWIMRLVPTGHEDYTEMGSDGRRIYLVLTSKEAIISAKQRGLPVPSNEATLMIHEGPRPTWWAGYDAGALWLAFCSMEYFANLERASSNSIQPLLESDGTIGMLFAPISYPTTWQRDSRPPGCLVALTQQNDGYRYYYRDRELSPLVEPVLREQLPPPYERGYTNVTYTVRRTEALDQLRVPAEFELSGFTRVIIQSKSRSAPLLLALRVRARVATLRRLTGSVDVIPMVPGMSSVRDDRFFTRSNRFPGIGYFTNRWLSDHEVRLLPEYNQAIGTLQRAPVNIAPRRRQPMAGARTIVWSTMVLVSVLCLAYVCKQAVRTNHEQK